MDVVSSGVRSGLSSEFLYANDLELMAPIMAQLGGRVDEWRCSLLDNGPTVNAGNSNVIAGSSGGNMIVNSGKWSCGVCGKECRRTLFSAQYVQSEFTSRAVVYVVGCRW